MDILGEACLRSPRSNISYNKMTSGLLKSTEPYGRPICLDTSFNVTSGVMSNAGRMPLIFGQNFIMILSYLR